ncbi:uncharacterized protein LAJ45_00138 [Morchella importuna]|uniref:FK506-binding protein n=1 Tax=Morchella conica CCBAS932 TaxID=1392247 RepID=A0A3N4KH83_9PEZI|nr:uncharacterized protein LAJ45_00138 [Morchella importuna]KAH8155129.1 hypothetical protein LAJ45_00138 [Morchella importuna]RPB08682.1 hypothetical protein P167DRAFT_336546 [Morchella conica CCBAS932]
MSLLPVAIWGLQVKADGSISPAIANIPATFRVTMAAIDPTAKPKDPKQPLRSTLKIMRRPLQNPDFDEDDEDDEETDSESEEESEEEAPSVKGNKGSKKSAAPAKKAAEEDEDEDDLDLSDDDEYEIEEFTICTLDTERNYQQPLDIVIGEDEECFFKVVGNFDISLTGNYVVGSGDADKYDEDSDEGDDYDLSPDEDELELYGDESDSDDLDDLEDPRIQEIATDDEAEAKNAAKKAEKKGEKKDEKKKAEKKSLKRSADESEGEEPTIADLIAKAKEVKEAAVATAAPEKKLSKKQLKKLKANDGKAVDATADKGKKVQFAKELEQGPTPSPAATEKKSEKKSAEKPVAEKSTTEKKKPESKQPKIVQGISIMDSKVGTGAAAKKGNRLSMRYIGKLDNGKIFDSNTKGKPFTFQLGKGEVIQGWDIGLEGMQVGGERRLRIPPGSAYGKKSLPGIPANSTLIFDVKLIEIK